MKANIEQQKVLWIVVSVALFIALVLGIGLWWYYPGKNQEVPIAAGGEAPAETGALDFDPIEWVRGDRAVPGLEAPTESREGDIVIVVGEGETVHQEVTIPGGGAAPSVSRTLQEPASADSGATDTAPAVAVAPKPAAPKPTTVAPSARTTPAPAVAAPKQAEHQASPQPKTVRIEEYWIQAASLTSRTRAEFAREQLEEKGIPAIITTKDHEGDTFYRVRIGPYPNKPEADKFLQWIRDVEGFEKSYVSLVYATRRL